MSNVARVAGQAANTLSKPLNVEDVFSTYLYTGNGSSQTITNGIDLDGEGGLVWIKNRDQADNHRLHDTVRGNPQNTLITNLTLNAFDQVNSVTGFNNNGFDIGSYSQVNTSGENFCSWTFRKAPKFFDVVTYTGNGTNQYINHNLGCEVGAIFIKRTDATANWSVYHRGQDATAPEDYYMILNLTDEASNNDGFWLDTAPTTTSFRVGNDNTVNANGGTYVAYLFAHNDGDGEFGDGTQDIIKCGSYTGTGSAGNFIDLGFEPQWLLVKATAHANQNWEMFDNMRGTPTGGNSAELFPNTSSAERSAFEIFNFTPTGFETVTTLDETNTSGNTFIYIAIRRGPMAVPTDATEVFALDGTYSASSPQYYSGWPVDFWMRRYDKTSETDYVIAMDRLRQNGQLYLNTTSTAAESFFSTIGVGQMDGADLNGASNSMAWLWRRAPSFFDAVAYTGNGTAGRTVSHNLGAAPEMMWVKARDSGATTPEWSVYHKDLGNDKRLVLNTTAAVSGSSATFWYSTTPTETEFYTGSTYVNQSGYNYIAYLFASLDGVSKVGSYAGDSTTGRVIDCGFSSGARFVLIKRTDGAGDWAVWDSERGIVAGNDSRLRLNDTSAEVTGYDILDPHSSGFIVNHTAALAANESGQSYIFYAIA